MDYRETLNLPKTPFPMKANLPAREPEWLKRWDEEALYRILRDARRGRPKFILHDGPPYANGDIHTGTALNKIVKDMINRYWALKAYDVAYVPGWDTHGLPIETRALKSLGISQHQIKPLELRRECRKVAERYIAAMTEEFIRLGVMADWEHPYITLDPAYEGEELRVFADMVERGLVYRDLMPVYWCPHCETALAEGEIEYRDHRSDAVYVAFAADTGGTRLPEGTRAVIWTTTPWTLPANVAIAVHPDLAYVVVQTEKGPLLLAAERVEPALAAMKLTAQAELARFEGRELEGVRTRHPFVDRISPLILGEHVTAESGTGLVHTAPGHGVEDFAASHRYGLPIIQPLNDTGHFAAATELVGELFYAKANPVIVAALDERGALLAHEALAHQYPFCWRCKNPVIYRATSQWFMSVDKIRAELDAATRLVDWDPKWGGDRMRRMVEDRQDWCLSRQRVWGVPIPAFYCENCSHAILDAGLIRRVADAIGREGSDIWWQKPAQAFLPEGFVCPHCGGDRFRKEKDIFDVWLDSGSSQAAVLATHPDLSWPADLVLEGADQYRGWFNSLLTTGVATRGRPPYKGVLTHGWVLDQSGQEMHKSLGNTVDPMDMVRRFGTDILRLWVAGSEFRTDVRISDELMAQVAESYRKIRNTFRFLLGNLADFNPRRDGVSAVRDPLNRWMADHVNRWLDEADRAFRAYEFHTVVHHTVRLVTLSLSNFYLDVVKDRLYTLAPSDPLRRETQTVLHHILVTLTVGLSPILVFTTEEVYQHVEPHAHPSVHLENWPEPLDVGYGEDERGRMERLMALREPVLKALEELRGSKAIGNSLEARVTLTLPPGQAELDAADRALLAEMTLAAGITVVEGEALAARAEKSDFARCDRCWRYVPDVGADPGHPDLCRRCADVLVRMGA